jgi:hypothetical protein
MGASGARRASARGGVKHLDTPRCLLDDAPRCRLDDAPRCHLDDTPRCRLDAGPARE